MNDVMTWIAAGALLLAAVIVLSFAGLKGWQGWLELKRLELNGRRGASTGERIELADLKERIRKLEAIASCVDL